ncbi:MAG: alpha/beta hydrolase [Blastocatellia bacterium]|nr:alpha/beta hydrolase [Blastocatellia bacterium]
MKSPIFYPETNGHPPPTAEVEIHTPEGVIKGLLHKAEGARGAMVMVSDAGGGLEGPAGLYEQLAQRLQKAGIMTLRIDYREPMDLRESIYDVLASIEAVRQQGADRVALLGWSFGGAVVITAGVASDLVVGVATIACQNFGAEIASDLSPKSLLIMHGTDDLETPDQYSRDIYNHARQPKELVLYSGGDHDLARHTELALDRLCAWSKGLLLVSARASGR